MREVQPKVGPAGRRVRDPAAATPVTHAHAVADVRAGAVDADERDVHLGIADGLARVVVAVVVDVSQFEPFRVGHDQVVDRLASRDPILVQPTVHLVQQVGHLREAAVEHSRGRGPGPRVGGLVGGLDIELDDRAVGLSRQDGAVLAVVLSVVTMRAVVEHLGHGETARPVVAVINVHRQRAGRVVPQPGRHGDRVGRAGDGRGVRNVVDDRRQIGYRGGVGRPG